MGLEQILLVLIGALAAGVVNGLTGFGTAITAMALWLYAIPPAVGASLAIICSVVSQIQNLHLIWRTISWERVLPFLVPGIIGVPLGTHLVRVIEPPVFKLGIGIFLVVYSIYVLVRRGERVGRQSSRVRGRLQWGGLAGLSGVLPVVWTDVRGWSKSERRSVVQTFNLAIFSLSLASHAFSGLLTGAVVTASVSALPATIVGAWLGALMHRRLAEGGYQHAVMLLLFVSGAGLVWASW
jgi:uncharacterized membrane protein YfcA